jgi:hypothetical protein
VENDGLTLQSTFDVNIKEEDYLASLCADPYLLVASMPPDDQLKKHYTKILEGISFVKAKNIPRKHSFSCKGPW